MVGFTSGPKATFISMGLGHACAVSDGNVYCWGGNVFGQLGTGDPVGRLSPTMVKGLRAGGLCLTKFTPMLINFRINDPLLRVIFLNG